MPKVIENLREKIIDEGKSILLNGNYAEFNIREIAKKCGIGVGTVYNYFKNKDQLAYEIFRNDWDKTLSTIGSLKGKEEPLKDKLFKIYSSMEEFIDSYLGTFREISEERGGSGECPHQHYMSAFKKMEDFLEFEKAAGNIKSDLSPDKLAYFIVNNMVYCIKDKHMSFDELFSCINL